MLSLLLDATTEGTTDWTSYLFIGAIILIVVVVFIVPSFSRNKKIKEAEEEKKFIRPGDKIKTVGGIVGIITEVNNVNEFEIELVLKTGTVGSESTMTFDINALYMIMERGEESLAALEEARLQKEAELQAKLAEKSAKKGDATPVEIPTESVEVFEESDDSEKTNND